MEKFLFKEKRVHELYAEHVHTTSECMLTMDVQSDLYAVAQIEMYEFNFVNKIFSSLFSKQMNYLFKT